MLDPLCFLLQRCQKHNWSNFSVVVRWRMHHGQVNWQIGWGKQKGGETGRKHRQAEKQTEIEIDTKPGGQWGYHCVRKKWGKQKTRVCRMRRTEPGTVIAVNESDEAKATGGTLDCSEVICSNWEQMNPSSGFIRPWTYHGFTERADRVAIRLSSKCFLANFLKPYFALLHQISMPGQLCALVLKCLYKCINKNVLYQMWSLSYPERQLIIYSPAAPIYIISLI